MRTKSYLLAAALFSVAVLSTPAASAYAATVSIAAVTPGQSVVANDRLTFVISSAGFTSPTYQLTDSFKNSSASLSNISGAGNFFWVPQTSDVGTHTFTVTMQDSLGNTATAMQTITVLPTATLTIGTLSPGNTVLPGTNLSFSVSSTGLTNPTFSVGDAFANGTSITSVNLDASGHFSWTPDQQQNGDHTITVYAYDSTGHNASASQLVHVGAGPTLGVLTLTPGAMVPVGTSTSFFAYPTNFMPTSFSVSDSFTGSTITNNNINTTGQFSWMPQASDIGDHLLTIKGTVGVLGQSATVTQKITVFGTSTTVPVVAPVVTAAASTTPVTTTTTRYVFNNFMAYGEDTTDGSDVLELQKRLQTLKFFTLTPNGNFGNNTLLAVKKFQKAHGITATGYVGSQTRAALNQ